MRISKHSKQRIIERDDNVNFVVEAKKTAKQAFRSGRTIGSYQSCPKFFSYLQKKRNQTYHCAIRVYRGNIYVWKGQHRTLVTAFPIPERFYSELGE